VQLNRQGADAGTQYRSVIFYEDEEQKDEAIKVPKMPKISFTPRACCVLRAACIHLFSYELLDWPMNL
jgi:peptide methionine sulfoxide reductase MsrA